MRDAGGNVLSGRTTTWISSNTGVATVNAQGVVTSVAGGSANITATSEGHSGSATVTVTAPVASVTVSIGSPTINIGQTTGANVSLTDADGRPLTGRVVTWASDNTAVATVNSSGQVTGVGAGTANITATSEGRSGSAVITVTPPQVVSVTVSLGSSILAIGSRTQATATAKDKDGNPLAGKEGVLSSDNPSVATITAQGVVTAVSVGTANITASSEGVVGSAPLTVAVTAGYGSSTEKTHIVDIGTTFAPTLSGSSAGATSFVSRATSVATVNAQGAVTGVAEGQGWIVATAPGFAPDSVYVIVPRNTTGPLLRTDLTNFKVQPGTTTVVTVILDTRSTQIGGTEFSVGFTTTPLVFGNPSVTVVGSPAPVVSTIQPGVFRVSLASGSPLSGQLILLRFTFTTPPTGSGPEYLALRAGFMILNVLDIVSPTGADLLPVSTSTRYPVIVQ